MIFSRKRFKGYGHWLQCWWYSIGSDERFTPKGERERLAYVAGLRDAMREADEASKVDAGNWDFESTSKMRLYRQHAMQNVHARANLFSERDYR